MRRGLRAGGTGIAAAGCWALAWAAHRVQAEIVLSFAALTLTLGAGGLAVLPSRYRCFIAGLRGAEILSSRSEGTGPDGDGPILSIFRDAARGRSDRDTDAEDKNPHTHISTAP